MDDFPSLGITLAGIKDFVQRYGGPEALHGRTTTSVCNDIMKHITAASGSSYCIQNKRSDFIGPADVFVSHAWGYKFTNVVDALQRWEASRAEDRDEQRQPTYFWFDIFSNSQHKSSGRKYEWWIDCFREAIGRFGRTLLVLEWDNPIPLSRI